MMIARKSSQLEGGGEGVISKRGEGGRRCNIKEGEWGNVISKGEREGVGEGGISKKDGLGNKVMTKLH